MTDRLALPDVNVLIALVHRGHVHHRLAHDWFAAVERFALTPITEIGLLRLSLNPTVVGRAIPASAALATVRSLRDDRRATFLTDDASLAAPQIELAALVGHRQVTDLHLVELAARHDAVLVTFDRALPGQLLAGDRHHVHLIG